MNTNEASASEVAVPAAGKAAAPAAGKEFVGVGPTAPHGPPVAYLPARLLQEHSLSRRGCIPLGESRCGEIPLKQSR